LDLLDWRLERISTGQQFATLKSAVTALPLFGSKTYNA
jgi:hypothetical protein